MLFPQEGLGSVLKNHSVTHSKITTHYSFFMRWSKIPSGGSASAWAAGHGEVILVLTGKSSFSGLGNYAFTALCFNLEAPCTAE